MSVYMDKARYFDKDTRMNMWEFDALSPEKKSSHYYDLSKIKKNALAVACLMKDYALTKSKNGENYALSDEVMNLSDAVSRTRIRKGEPEIFDAPLAKYEKFRKEPAPGSGTGFLVLAGKKKNKILTAGHCVCVKDDTSKLRSQVELNQIRVVFGYHKTDLHTDKKTFANDDVYKVKKVIAHSYNYNNEAVPDWALVKLDREVVGIEPIEVDFSAKEGNSVYVIGCPIGLAVKCAGIGHSVIRSVESDFIHCDLDTFGGNSGSPIIDRVSNRAIGILIKGQTDYAIDTEYLAQTGIRRVITYCVQANGKYEKGQRIYPHLLDFHLETAKQGRKIRKERSDNVSIPFEYNYPLEMDARLDAEYEYMRKERSLAIKFLISSLILFPLAPLIIPEALDIGNKAVAHYRKRDKEEYEKYDDVLNIVKTFEKKVNFVEAFQLSHWKESATDENQVKLQRKIARNYCAYFFPGGEKLREGETLYEIEVEKFNRRFSPEKIFDLMLYSKIHMVEFCDSFKKDILTYMQKQDHQHYVSDLPDEQRLDYVSHAWWKAKVKDLKNSSKYANYPIEYIEQIVELYVTNNARINLEDVRIKLGLPNPQT